MKILKASVILFTLILSSTSLYSQRWVEYLESAKIYRKTNLDKAIEYYKLAQEDLKNNSFDKVKYAEICDLLGRAYYLNKNEKESEKSYKEALTNREEIYGTDQMESMNSYVTMGIFYYNTGAFKKAEPYFLKAKAIYENINGKGDLTYATLCNKIGNLYREMEEYPKSLSMLLESKDIRENLLGNEDTIYAESCHSLANLYLDMEDYLKAEQQYIKALQIQEISLGTGHFDYALTCGNLGYLYRIKGQHDKAEPLLLHSKIIKEKVLGKNNPMYLEACNSLAILYKNMVQYEKAESQFLDIMQIQEKYIGKDDPKYAKYCNNLGVLYKEMGQFLKAERLLKSAKDIRKKYIELKPLDYSSSCLNLANLYKEMNMMPKAKELYIEATKIDEANGGLDNLNYATSCIGLASYYMDLGEFENAEQLYLRALAIQEKRLGVKHPSYASTCSGLAVVNEKMENNKIALSYYTKAKEIWQETLGNLHPYYGLSCANLANFYWKQRQTLKAEEEFIESFAVNDYNQNTFFQFTNEKEKAAFIKNVLGEDDNAYSFFYSEKIASGLPYTISLFRRNLILSSLQSLKQQLFSTNDSVLSNKFNEWMRLKKYLSELYSMPVYERKDDPVKMEEIAGQLEKELVRSSSGFKKQMQKTDWKDIQEKLQGDEASIEFVSFHFNHVSKKGIQEADSILYIALILKKDKLFPVMVPLFKENQLMDVLSAEGKKEQIDIISKIYSTSVEKGNNKPSSTSSIYELIWKPLENELKGINTIYFAPTGLLHNIAFAAVPVNNNQVLSDIYRLVQLTSTASVTNENVTAINNDDIIQLYGGIEYDVDSITLQKVKQNYLASKSHLRSYPEDISQWVSSWEYLQETTSEVLDIEQNGKKMNYQIKTSTGVFATEESIKALNGKASPSVLHIATHGFFFPKSKPGIVDSNSSISDKAMLFKQSDDPLFRSGLVFAGANNAWTGRPLEGVEDGILTAYEVSNLYLPNTKLAVLSACQTGLGDIQGNEGVFGLQRAFQMAGVQNLVMSLWQVPSAETSEFMQVFYQNIFANESISDSFYKAQKTMKEKYRNTAFNWAAWVLVR